MLTESGLRRATRVPNFPELFLIEPTFRVDSRGKSFESFRREWFTDEFVQDYISVSMANTLRGMHYQVAPFAQAKLLRVIEGAIFDVVVEMATGLWTSFSLTGSFGRSLYIPPGYAHGFYAWTDFTTVVYKMSAYYDPASERTLAWDDEEVGIDWPIKESLTISEKDQHGKSFEALFRELASGQAMPV